MIEITFTPLHSSTLHTLRIGSGSGSPTVVDGLRDAFTTMQEDSTDVFLPVRGTSGTARFYNKDNAWGTLAVASDQTHIPVVLSAGGSTVWQGYVNTGYVGSRRLFGFNEDCDLSVQCPLQELDTQEYDPLDGAVNPRESAAMVTLEDVIADILDDPFGDGVVNGASMPPAGDVNVGIVLGMYVSQLAFYDVSVDDDGNQVYEPKYTKKTALEAVLRQACCTAQWTGTSVKIDAYRPDTSVAVALTPSPVDMESTETAVMPFKKIKVTAEANGEDTPVELPSSAIENWVTVNTDQQKIKELAFGDSLARYAAMFIYGAKGMSDWQNITDSEYSYKYVSTTDESEATVVGYSEWDNGRVRLSPAICLHDYPFGNIDPENPVFDDEQVMTHTLVVQRQAPFFVYDAYLDISLKFNFNLAPSTYRNRWDRDGTIEMYVIIGNKMFNPESNTWVTKPPRESFRWFGVEFNDGELVKKNYSDWNYEEPSGYAIPVPADTPLSGVVEVGIRTYESGGDKQNSNVIVTVEHFQVKALRHIKSIHEKNTFTASGNGRGEDNVQLDFCSERRADNGVNALFYKDGNNYVIVKNINNGPRPEQWVADRRAAMTTGKPRSLIILRQEGDIADGKYTYNGKTYQTMITKREWAENIIEKQLIEL